MCNIMIVDTLYGHNKNVANIKTQHQEIMATIKNKVLKLKPIIKMSIVTNYLFATVLTFSNINFFT